MNVDGQAMIATTVRCADFSRTCEGCEYIRTEIWKMGTSLKEATAYRCFAPGPRQGYHMGTERLFPYIPAWCPKMERDESLAGQGD